MPDNRFFNIPVGPQNKWTDEEAAGVAAQQRARNKKVWIVYKQWPTGKIERVAAYFSEKLAREHAGQMVGKDQALVGLETINVLDEPPAA